MWLSAIFPNFLLCNPGQQWPENKTCSFSCSGVGKGQELLTKLRSKQPEPKHSENNRQEILCRVFVDQDLSYESSFSRKLSVKVLSESKALAEITIFSSVSVTARGRPSWRVNLLWVDTERFSAINYITKRRFKNKFAFPSVSWEFPWIPQTKNVFWEFTRKLQAGSST